MVATAAITTTILVTKLGEKGRGEGGIDEREGRKGGGCWVGWGGEGKGLMNWGVQHRSDVCVYIKERRRRRRERCCGFFFSRR